jgi:methionyl-tRNA synthetase
MWQAMLMAAQLPNSKQIIINGFFTGEGGIKMSKSIGNEVNPDDELLNTELMRFVIM